MTFLENPPPPPAPNLIPPAPGQFPGGPPDPGAPPARKKSSIGRTVVLAVLAGFLLAFVVPVLALTLLGSTVEGGDPSGFTANEIAPPDGAQVSVAEFGTFTIDESPLWTDREVQPSEFTGLDSTFWLIPTYETQNFFANVNVASARVPAGTTLEMFSQAELDFTEGLLEVANVEVRNREIDGAVVREMSFDGTLQGVDVSWYMVFHIDGATGHQVTLSTGSEVFDEARAEFETNMLSLRSIGG